MIMGYRMLLFAGVVLLVLFICARAIAMFYIDRLGSTSKSNR